MRGPRSDVTLQNLIKICTVNVLQEKKMMTDCRFILMEYYKCNEVNFIENHAHNAACLFQVSEL